MSMNSRARAHNGRNQTETQSAPARRVAQRGGVVSLERALSKLGVASRTEARRHIERGEVAVDGKIQTDPALRLDLKRATITLQGKQARPAERCVHLLHKRRGTLTSARDPSGRPTIFDGLPSEFRRLHPVGRLDFATSGLLLLTNDTQLSAWLTAPQSHVERVYTLTVRGELDQVTAERWLHGVSDHGELLRAKSVRVRKASRRETHLVVTLLEGKNREIRRLCSALGHEPTRLARVAFGALTLEGLAPGQHRRASEAELRAAFPSYYSARRR